MGKERIPMDDEKIKSIVSSMSRKNKYSKDIIELVARDLKYGLTAEETKSYTKNYKDVRQMRVMSNCIREELPKKAVELICQSGMKAGQMEVLYNMYMETRNLDYVRDIYINSHGSVVMMKNMYKKCNEVVADKKAESEKNTSTDVTDNEITTANDMLISPEWDNDSDEEFYDEEELQARISEVTKAADVEKQQLIERIAEKDGQIEDIQNQFNSCFSENKKLSREIGELKEQLANERAANEKLIELNKEEKNAEVKIVSEDEKEPEKEAKQEEEVVMERQMQTPVGIPIYYPVNIVDIYGNVIGTTVPERQEKKTSSFGGIISRLLFKRKTRIDIVKLVSSSELTAEQLCLIKSAIGNGLTDKQIETLVQNKLSPDRMKEVIEIAVLEKGMA